MPAMRVTPGQLTAFEAIARHGSFSSAANELFVTRPAVSKKIRLLQEEVGKRIYPTDAGRAGYRQRALELSPGLVPVVRSSQPPAGNSITFEDGYPERLASTVA